MNILIMVFSFLAALALSVASFWHIMSNVRLETASFCGYMEASRKAENSLQDKLFKSLPSTNDSPSTAASKNDEPAKQTSAVFRSHRLKYPPHPFARLQLSALWETDSHPFVEKTFQRLLNELYGHTPWFAQARDSGRIDILIRSTIAFGKKSEGEFELHELVSSLSPTEADLLYRMLKGTHNYGIEDKTGYPPLLDFVSFTADNIKQTCHFCFASMPLLRAVFDKDTVSHILALEKQKWEKDHKRHTCTKEELLTFLRSHPASLPQPDTINTYLHFGKKAAPTQKGLGVDATSGIHSERSLRNNTN